MEVTILNYSDGELTLFTLSLVKASIIFWEHTKIQTEVQSYFSNNDKDAWKPEAFHKITGKVLDLADVSVEVVPALLPELKDAILNTGMKIYNWIVYVTSELGLNVSCAKKIYWTALGFVDHEKIFESIWAKDSTLFEGSPYKPIFRVACLLTQVDFVEKHETEMIEELEKLLLRKNSNDVDFWLENCSGKTYGIISSYLCYYLYQHWQIVESKGCIKKERRIWNPEYPEDVQGNHFQDVRKFTYNIDNYINRTIHDGEILRPVIMAKLCGFLGSIYGLKYYYKELNSSQKRYVNDWMVACCVSYLGGVKSNSYLALKCREILTFTYSSDPNESGKRYWENQNVQLNVLFNFCPLESVVWKSFIKWLNEIECNRKTLNNLLRFIAKNVKSDYLLRLPIRRSLHQKLLKEIWGKVKKSKIKHWKRKTINDLIALFVKTNDFTNLKTLLNSCKWDPQEYLSYTFDRFDFLWCKTDSPNFDGPIKFFNEMFKSSEDRNHFFNKQFYKSYLLLSGDFEKWENLYTALIFSNRPLRNQIDPVKCLSSLAGTNEFILKKRIIPAPLTNIYTSIYDKFITWWADSHEEQLAVKKKFKKSSHAFECLYCIWLNSYIHENSLNDYTLELFRWLFGSDRKAHKAMQKFKKKVSIIGLLDFSFDNTNSISLTENLFQSVFDQFINFFEIRAKDVDKLAKRKEVKGKIKEVMLNHAKIKNILTLEFLMDWVLMSEEDRKEIFKKLTDSGKMMDLCEEVLCTSGITPGIPVFYNKWLKLYGNVSKVKSHIISIYKDEADDNFMSKLSFMFEKLERGEDLISDDIVLDC